MGPLVEENNESLLGGYGVVGRFIRPVTAVELIEFRF
jgi:hypothetical protein